MTHNQEKIDEIVLATLLLILHNDNRAWKNHFFEVLDRLYGKGFIYDPKGKVKEVFDGLFLESKNRTINN